MDIFKYLGTPQSPYQKAELIPEATSKTWIERYSEFGEFEITAPIWSGVREALPIGTKISHIETDEIMIVESHEIQDDDGFAVDVRITGRSLDVTLFDRVVGTNLSWPLVGSTIPEHTLAEAEVWDQIVTLINGHILPGSVVDPDDSLPNLVAVTNITETGVAEARPVDRGDLYTRVVELLEVDNLGMKVIRPGVNSPFSGIFAETNAALLIHCGTDCSQTSTFSFSEGDLSSGKYLWSSKNVKTSALVVGKWVATMVHGAEINSDRRVMVVEAKDLDESYSNPPTGATKDAIIASMQTRGRQALAAQKDVAIIGVDIKGGTSNHTYRKDYNIGDIVAVQGNYNTETTMRVTEHVEIEDQNGRTSYPTLSRISDP